MQTSLASVCLSGSLSDTLRSAAEESPDYVELFETDVLSVDGEPEQIPEGIAAMLVLGLLILTFMAGTVAGLPRALRF